MESKARLNEKTDPILDSGTLLLLMYLDAKEAFQVASVLFRTPTLISRFAEGLAAKQVSSIANL
jgi:hypothetical protein